MILNGKIELPENKYSHNYFSRFTFSLTLTNRTLYHVSDNTTWSNFDIWDKRAKDAINHSCSVCKFNAFQRLCPTKISYWDM